MSKSFRRYWLLIDKIKTGQYPSFQNLREHLQEHDFSVSERTIQRDIEQIRLDYGLEIMYDRYKNGYYIDEENSINVPSFFRFLEMIKTADILTDTLKEGKDSLKQISFEAEGISRGSEFLRPVLEALRMHRKIGFAYQSFYSDKAKAVELEPYLLKEYQNRWYIIGIDKNKDDFRTYALDRIKDLIVSGTSFKPQPSFDPESLFEDTVGLTYSSCKAERVVLSFTPNQAKYVETLPLHPSQEKEKETKDEVIFSLYVKPNFEFIQKVMMQMDQVKVLEPEWLVSNMKRITGHMARKY